MPKWVSVFDTTGAGDLYGAGFIYGYLKGWSMEKTLKFASASGNLAVTFYGGMDESYSLDKVMEYYRMYDSTNTFCDKSPLMK